MLDLIGELYAVEKQCATGPPGDTERAELRATRSRDIVRKIEKWALGVEALPGSTLRKASSTWAGCFASSTVPIDNNGTERSLRGIVIGRKNHTTARARSAAPKSPRSSTP